MDKLVFSCFLLGGLTPDPAPDSCALLNPYCATGLTNVGCNPPPITGGSACDGKSPEVVPLLEEEQTAILDAINSYRNSISAGDLGNPKANRMLKLQWDASLATQAGHNARSCVVARDACRNTADYANVGQLISSYHGGPTTIVADPPASKASGLISYLMDFSAFYNGSASFSSYSASSNVENEANIVNDRSTKVGCAFMQWTEGDQTYIYLVCNFSANVIEGEPIYTAAATAGLGCATTDTTYPALCLT